MAEDEGVERGNGSARNVARALALVLIAGGLLAALGGNGFARMLRGGSGYADFGYVPQQCGIATSEARAINGDVVRVCQESRGTTKGLFVGHYAYPLSYSDTTLHLALPDAKLHFAWRGCCSSPLGTWTSFTAPVFDPIVAGNPQQGAARFAGAHGGTTYVQVTQTARLNTGASAYTLTWAITNTSGAAQHVRPLVAVSSYGWGAPIWSTTASPRTVALRSPTAGGAISLAESGVDGSPAVSGYTAGSWERVNDFERPDAPALDNTLHDDGGYVFPGDSEMAVAWAPVTLAAGATGRFSVTIGLSKPRELMLSLHGAAPVADAPTLLDARVTEDRAIAGRHVYWDVYRGGAHGDAIIGADGNALLSIPGASGQRYVRAFVDTNGNGIEDDDEPADSGWIYAPKPEPQPTETETATPAPTATEIPVTPVVPQVAPTAKPFLDSPLHIPFNKTLKVKASRRAKACKGSVTVAVLDRKRVLQRRSVKLTRRCAVKTTLTVPHSVLGSVRKLTVVVTPPRKNHYLKTTRFTIGVPPAP